jgi:nucleotide-binding universal stress UspA family protein
MEILEQKQSMNILVPTDFSSYAKYGFDLACDIVKITGGAIHLYHAARIPDDWEDLPLEDKLKDSVNEAIANEAQSKLDELEQKAKGEGISVTTHYTGGAFVENLDEMLSSLSVDLIVMGSHGVGGQKELFIGSNAQKVIRKYNISILVVKHETSRPLFSKVLFASNLNEEDKKAFNNFLKFLEPFKVDEVYIMAVNTRGFFSQPALIMEKAMQGFREIAKDYKCHAHFYPDYSVEAGIRHFTEEKGISLIGLSNHIKHPIKRLIQGSNVEMVVGQSDAPVLSIDY